MKVLQLINSLATGGAEKLVLDTVPLLNEKGIKTDLAVLNGTDHPFLLALKKQNCCTIISLGKGSLYNPLLIFKIIRFFKQYDVIHVHIFPALYWVALAKMISLSNIKLVYTEHSTSNHRRHNLFYKMIDRIMYSNYSKIITISPEVDFNIKKHLDFDTNQFELIQNGINLELIKQVKPLSKEIFFPHLKGHLNILIQVASFRYPKDQKTLIKSLTHLDDTITLLLVGDGPLRAECEAYAKSLGLSNRVAFLGIRMDVTALLKTADIVVLSSRHEGLSLSSIEGMASGRPFMASDAPGLGELVRHAGILFPIQDDVELATQINKLLTDKSYYDTTVYNCLKKAEAYSIDSTIDKLIKVYKTL
ncbi:glycosyl transferase family 1 [Yeosuana aromativorans]|uniref:Glycosyl transferase family 1 n=1 Tax=Yeosuana aromativorans TaxID=288019 RepID=A0A8J3BM39_9FLAO|nr:glycosyltransferase [Yeosuana aromativorans]GGK29001.1 glycosyl transferase family 1 [Yeosuana aromativorans]